MKKVAKSPILEAPPPALSGLWGLFFFFFSLLLRNSRTQREATAVPVGPAAPGAQRGRRRWSLPRARRGRAAPRPLSAAEPPPVTSPATHRPGGRRPRRSPSSSSFSSASGSPQGCPTFLLLLLPPLLPPLPGEPAVAQPAGLMGGRRGCPAHAWAPQGVTASRGAAPSPGRAAEPRLLRCGGEQRRGAGGRLLLSLGFFFSSLRLFAGCPGR